MAARRKSGIVKTDFVIIAGGRNSAISVFWGLSFEQKVVVITGGSRGLELAMAREFALQGAELALLSRDKEKLWRASAELLGSKATSRPGSVRESPFYPFCTRETARQERFPRLHQRSLMLHKTAPFPV